jgi:hypothetical protein
MDAEEEGKKERRMHVGDEQEFSLLVVVVVSMGREG